MKHDPAPVTGAPCARIRAAMPSLARTLGLAFLLLAAAPPALAQVLVSVVAADDTAAESPPDDGAFTVRRVGGDMEGPVTVTYSVGGSATPNQDYAGLPGSLTLGAGQVEMPIPVDVSGDDGVDEGDETVTITLQESEGVGVVDATATVTILDSESGEDFGEATASTAANAVENPPSNGQITVSLGVGNNTGAPVIVQYSVGGSATASIDYVALSGAVSIPVGASAGTITVTPLDDELVENDESVEVSLSGTNHPDIPVGAARIATVIITDDDEDDDDDDDDGDDDDGDDDDGGGNDDEPVEVSIAAADDSAAETPSDEGEFVVRRVGGDAERDVRIEYSVAGSAAPGDDYRELSGRVDLRQGQSEASIRLDPGGDDGLFEGDESVTVTLESSEDVVVVDGTATVTIHDTPHTVGISTSADAAEPATAGRVTVSLTATNASGGALTVEYSVGGTATAGSDYAALSGTAQIGAGASSASIEVTPIDDAADEADETVTVTLTGTSSAAVTVGSFSTSSVTIVDDDAAGGDDDGDDDGGDEGSADDDDDGLSNDEEQQRGTDPGVADTDGDGVADGAEVSAGTDPLDEQSFADADADLVPDAVEAGDGTDPGDATSFADGDRGGTADHVETVTYTSFGLPPTNIADASDDRRDFDGDGLPDRLEIGSGSDAGSSDSPTAGGAGDDDGNGISNAVEAYLATFAIDTVDRVSDRDRDGYPDAAEVSLGLNPVRASERDSDGDGVPDVVEVLAGLDVDPGTDSDDDGVPDAREIALGTDTLDANSPVANGAMDDDGDGVSNAIEEVLRLLGAVDDATADGDEDGDGITDADEIRLGTDPLHDEQPAVWVELAQGEIGGADALLPGGGPATARALVGGHQAGTFTFDWSGSDDAILAVSSGSQSASALAFSPETLPAGPYTVSVEVRRTAGDYESPPTTVGFVFVVLESGATGGTADADQDGVPDSSDGADARAGLAHQLEAGPGGRMQAEPGLKLQLGATARVVRAGEARVTFEQITNAGDGSGGSVENGADEFDYPGGIYDFEVTNLPEVGAAVQVVIPQGMGIGEGAEYRKFQPERGWGAFVEDEGNALASAPGPECPPPGDDSYEPGLTPGHLCVQLTIQDGGPNDGDADLGANGVVKDPGGVATATGQVTVGQGSGSVGPLWLVLLSVLGWIAAGRRSAARHQRRTRPVSRCTKSEAA